MTSYACAQQTGGGGGGAGLVRTGSRVGIFLLIQHCKMHVNIHGVSAGLC